MMGFRLPDPSSPVTSPYLCILDKSLASDCFAKQLLNSNFDAFILIVSLNSLIYLIYLFTYLQSAAVTEHQRNISLLPLHCGLLGLPSLVQESTKIYL